jgi:HSP20 family protein
MFQRIPSYQDELLSQFRRLEQEFDTLLSGGTSWTGSRNIRSFPAGTFPAVNIGATPDTVTVYVFAPGLDPKTLDTSIRQNLLTIAGQREVDVQKDATYYRQERFSGAFRRMVSLPEDVDPERVEAKYVDGIVHVSVGRRASAKPRQIEIH